MYKLFGRVSCLKYLDHLVLEMYWVCGPIRAVHFFRNFFLWDIVRRHVSYQKKFVAEFAFENCDFVAALQKCKEKTNKPNAVLLRVILIKFSNTSLGYPFLGVQFSASHDWCCVNNFTGDGKHFEGYPLGGIFCRSLYPVLFCIVSQPPARCLQ